MFVKYKQAFNYFGGVHMIKNIISYVIPFGGLIILFCSFHFFDKYAASSTDDQIDAEKPLNK